MNIDPQMLLTILGMGAVTYATRVGGYALLRRIPVQGRFKAGLEAALSRLIITPAIHWVHHHRRRVDTDAPAVTLLRRAFASPGVLKGVICHGMWLVSTMPETVAGRRVTCHNNLIGDVRNMGAVYTDQDVVVDGDLVTGRSADVCHLFARTIIDLVAARSVRGPRLASRLLGVGRER